MGGGRSRVGKGGVRRCSPGAMEGGDVDSQLSRLDGGVAGWGGWRLRSADLDGDSGPWPIDRSSIREEHCSYNKNLLRKTNTRQSIIRS